MTAPAQAAQGAHIGMLRQTIVELGQHVMRHRDDIERVAEFLHGPDLATEAKGEAQDAPRGEIAALVELVNGIGHDLSQGERAFARIAVGAEPQKEQPTAGGR